MTRNCVTDARVTKITDLANPHYQTEKLQLSQQNQQINELKITTMNIPYDLNVYNLTRKIDPKNNIYMRLRESFAPKINEALRIKWGST